MDGGSVRVQIWYDLAISPYPRNGSDWTHQMPLSVQRRTIMIVATGHVVAIVLDDWMC